MSERQTKAGNQITLSLFHSHSLSLTLVTLNNFCFHVYAQKSLSLSLKNSRGNYVHDLAALVPHWDFSNILILRLVMTGSLLLQLGHTYDLVVIHGHTYGHQVTVVTQSYGKAISSHSFENFLTIPLPNSISLQCAKNSAYLESLRHLIWILAKKWFRLGHNCDLINLDMT